jgi:hypothetical protein
MDTFGVIRADILASTPLIERHLGADRTLLLELALCGRFLLVPEFLFNRDHVERFTRRGVTPQEELAWYAADHGRRIVSRTWTLYGMSLRPIPRRVDGRPERARCYGRLRRSVGYRRRWLDFVVEPVVALDPRLFNAFRTLKRLVRGHNSRQMLHHATGATSKVKVSLAGGLSENKVATPMATIPPDG